MILILADSLVCAELRLIGVSADALASRRDLG